MFSAPGAGPSSEPQSKAGSFTQLFGNAPNAGPSVDPLARAAPVKSAPGSFTQMLHASAPAPAAQPGSFMQMLNAPSPAQAQPATAPPQPPVATSAGAPAQPSRSNYDVLAGGGSGATTVFGSGSAPAPAAMPSGPSQFTQVLSGSEMRKLAMQAQQQPNNPGAMALGARVPMPPVAPPGMPQMPQMMPPGMPMPPQPMPPQMAPLQMPQMQPMQMPPVPFTPPQMQMQPLQVPMPPKPAGFAQYAPLIAILCAIGFVAVLLVLLFAIKH